MNDNGTGLPTFALLIVGSRTITDYDFVRKKIDTLTEQIRKKYRLLIVSGGCPRGVDAFAERYARENGLGIKVIKADWRAGKKAGYERNEEMHKFIAAYDHRGCIAFWDNTLDAKTGKPISRGTLHSIELAKKYNNEIRFIVYKRRKEGQAE
jgi:hypothetical protein